jgi:hypothetical protein
VASDEASREADAQVLLVDDAAIRTNEIGPRKIGQFRFPARFAHGEKCPDAPAEKDQIVARQRLAVRSGRDLEKRRKERDPVLKRLPQWPEGKHAEHRVALDVTDRPELGDPLEGVGNESARTGYSRHRVDDVLVETGEESKSMLCG